MANWLCKIDIAKEWHTTPVNLVILAKAIIKELEEKVYPYISFGHYEEHGLLDEFEILIDGFEQFADGYEDDIDKFDSEMENLYNFGDTTISANTKLVWINTFSVLGEKQND